MKLKLICHFFRFPVKKKLKKKNWQSKQIVITMIIRNFCLFFFNFIIHNKLLDLFVFLSATFSFFSDNYTINLNLLKILKLVRSPLFYFVEMTSNKSCVFATLQLTLFCFFISLFFILFFLKSFKQMLLNSLKFRM